ncbi:hypothetical protein C6P40_001905 [Pichia californica]|uniref:INO80 complex subunit B-like conserved region domain-containing protein n=1 Tax=Pichia californica TaxID=460514 RepID=A0A9P6WQT9_9ASCO|nr:hypothetical protein C6P42_003201 [[Candida] californica]KAG0690682.1 hypothetical protein C6P40_001905 [[Candida] californica]
MAGRLKRETLKKSGLGSNVENYDKYDVEENLDDELENEDMQANNSILDILGTDDEEDERDEDDLDDGELDVDEGYEEAFNDDGGYEEDFEEFGGRQLLETGKNGKTMKSPKSSANPKKTLTIKSRAKPKAQLVTVTYQSSSNLLMTLKLNKKKFSKVVNAKKPKKEGKSRSPVSIIKDNTRKRNTKVSYIEPNEDDDFGSDIDDFDSIVPGLNDDEEEGEDKEGVDVDDDDEEDDDIGIEEDESDIDLSKLSERQRSKVLGISEEPEELTPEFYNGKKLPKSVLALMEGGNKKKPLTEEEMQLRKAEAARKRKTFNQRKLEAEKKETLKKLLHRKIEKVDAKKLELENERRLQNKQIRRELITHKALFSWVSKTEVIDGEKTSVSLYSMQ